MPRFTSLLALFGLVLLAAPAARGQSRLYSGLEPLGAHLTPDGQLAPGTPAGSFDARGYTMQMAPGGAPQFVPAAPSGAADGAWDDRFGLPGVSFSEVFALLVHDADLYVAGFFSEAGGAPIASIARWDGHRWWPLGAGLDGTAHALAWYKGELYAGGSIRKAGSILANGIARWNGQAWEPVGDGLASDVGDPDVMALAVFKGELYVGGQFNSAGGVAAIGLARWDGQAWRSAGGNVLNQPYDGAGEVHALAASATHLYAGGSFDEVGGVAAAAIARWDGSHWEALGEGIEGQYAANVMALALSGSDLYVGGDFIKAGGVAARNVARWNVAAGTWSALGGGVRGDLEAGEVRALEVVGGSLFVAGRFDFAGSRAAVNIARWDGAAWTALEQDGANGVTSFSPVNALAPAAGGVYLAGSFYEAGPLAVNRIARWDGARFRALGEGVQGASGFSGTVYAIATAGDGRVYAAGQFHYAGSAVAENVAMWDGAEWHALGSGADGIVYSIATQGTDVFIGGRFTSVGGIAASHVARWDGQAWHALGAGVNGYVWALLPDGDNDLYVGGDFTAAGTVPARDLARWDGQAWHELSPGVTLEPGGVVYALLRDGDFLWVGGDFEYVKFPGGYATVNSLAVWKMSTDEWFQNGGVTRSTGSSDVWGRAFSLAMVNGELYVGGMFDKVGGVLAASGVARFDGTAWHALGSGIGGEVLQEVSAFAAQGTDLYVGGRFSTAGTATSRGIARWNAATQAWSSLDGGIGGLDFTHVYALARHGDALYAGGIFGAAGPTQAAAFALWHAQGTPPPASATIRLSSAEVAFSPTIAGQSSDVDFTISNASGTATLAGAVEGTTGPFSVVAGGGAFSLAPGASKTLTLRFSPTAAGAAAGTLRITHNAGNTASPLVVPLSGMGESSTQNVTLRLFDPGSSQYYVTVGQGAAEGFVFGTNKYLDRAKGVAFSLPTGFSRGTVTQVKAWFAYRTAGAEGAQYRLAIYDGTAESGPTGAPRYTKTYNVKDIVADDDLNTGSSATVFALDQPVAVGTSFFVVFDFGDYPATQAARAGLASTNVREGRVAEAWEQWQDGTWANVSDAWTGQNAQPGTGTRGWLPWISADVTVQASTPVEDAPRAGATTLAQSIPNPTAGATTIPFSLARSGPVRLVVFDVLGREVARLVDGVLPAGTHEAPFDAALLPAGTYVYALQSEGRVLTHSLVVVR